MKLRTVQALRALAALLVVGDHFPRLEAKLFPNGLMHGFGSAGAIGVDLFFVISGFIMVSTTWKSFGKRGASQLFLTRRFLRIYPAYWPALLMFVLIGTILPAALYVAPVTVASLTSSFFLIPHGRGPLLFVAWSLEFEVYFYIVFALALRFSRTYLGLIFGVWCAFTLALNVAAHFIDNDAVQFLGSPLALEFMGGGIVGYLVLHKHVFAPRVMLALGAVFALGVSIYSAQFPDGFGTLGLTWFRVLAAGPAMMLIVYGAVVLEEQGRIVAPRFAVALGDASYSMYLWHGMLLGAFTAVVARLHLHGRIADVAYVGGGLLVVALGALLIYRLLEAPLITAAKRFVGVPASKRQVAVPAP